MDVKTVLLNAFDCHKDGRIMQAEELYTQAIQELLNRVTDKDTDEQRKKVIYERLDEYISTAEQLKARMQREYVPGEALETIAIEENSTGHSYNALFGKYLTGGLQEMILEEPYITEKYHFHSVISLLELVVKKCQKFKYIRIVTKRDAKDESAQRSFFTNLGNDLDSRGIRLSIKFIDSLHDRKIILSTGYIFILGRGLHIFKAQNPLYTLGLLDYEFRKCYQSDVHIFRTKTK